MARKRKGRRVSAGELEILQTLWRHGAATLSEAHRALGRKIGYTTVQTRLNRLVDKGLARRSADRPARYAAAVSQREVSVGQLDLLLERVSGGSVVPLVAHLDENEARNRAMIEQRLGRQVVAGAVSTNDVIAMTSAGVDEPLIINHIRAHGMATPITAGDLIALKQRGISPAIIDAMQTSPPKTPVVVQQPAPQPVVVEEYYYGHPYWGPPPYRYYHHRPYHCRPGVSWGVMVGN